MLTKKIAITLLLIGSQHLKAAPLCEALDSAQVVEVKELTGQDAIIRAENWKEFDVIANFDPTNCVDNLSQTVISVNGKKYYSFTTAEDECDGGNVYGAIYSYDLKTVEAHIYDGDAYCEDDWRQEDRAIYHRCDLVAEKAATERMAAIGLDFTPTSSYVDLRKPYIYSNINISGYINSDKDRAAGIRTDIRLDQDSCEISSMFITSLEI